MSDPTQRLHETVFLSLPVSSSLFLSLNLSIPHSLFLPSAPPPLFLSLAYAHQQQTARAWRNPSSYIRTVEANAAIDRSTKCQKKGAMFDFQA